MKKIFISAGHSDKQSGAVNGSIKEADVVRDFRDIVAFKIDQLGGDCITDGQKGVNIPLTESIKLVPKDGVAVEFHLNVGPPGATGVETLSAPHHYPFCKELCLAVSTRLGIRNRGAKPENSGQHKTLAFVQAGGIVLELYFITNPDDQARYDKVKWLLAEDIAKLLIQEASK